MKKVIKLTEKDIEGLVKKIIKEEKNKNKMSERKYLNTVRIRIADEDFSKLRETIEILENEGWQLVKKHKPGGTYFADMEKVIYSAENS